MRRSEWPRHAISYGVAPGRGRFHQLMSLIRQIGTANQVLPVFYLACAVDAPIQLVKLRLGRHWQLTGRGA